MKSTLTDYYFLNDGMFVIPIEQLNRKGIDPGFSDELLKRNVLSEKSVALFDQAFANYWVRAKKLSRKAPQFWFPPRVQHICIVKGPTQIRPYFQPFHRNSWLLYASDFDEQTSTVEFATYQFLHVERMVLLQQIVPALSANLSYFLTLTEQQAREFCDGCNATNRPDAAGFRALAKAMPAVRQLYHQVLKKPAVALPGASLMQGNGVVVPASTRNQLGGLQQAWGSAAQEVVSKYQTAQTKPSLKQGAKIVDWLVENSPGLLVTGDKGQILWSPDQPDQVDSLKLALAQVSEAGEEGIYQDLRVVDDCTQRFFSSLTAPEELADPAPYITEGGLSYIHKDHKLIGYHIGPGQNQNRLWESTPPYERLMLAARTVHEWGHLAAESDWVVIPEEQRQQRQDLTEQLVDLFEEIHSGAPMKVRAAVSAEVRALQAKHGSLGQGLLKGMLVRIEDFMANLVSRQFLDDDEMDTYVRNNVCCHMQDYRGGAVYMQLCRQAYEFQYLSLSRIPDRLNWFYQSTWFAEQFIQPRIISSGQFERLIDVIGQICGCYRIDESKFDLRDRC